MYARRRAWVLPRWLMNVVRIVPDESHPCNALPARGLAPLAAARRGPPSEFRCYFK